MAQSITIEELISELGRIESSKPTVEGFSLAELAEEWRTCEETVRRRLRVLNRKGLLEAGKRREKDIAGRMNWKPVYKLKMERKGGKSK